MNKDVESIKVFIFSIEVGTLAYDKTRAISYFQYNNDYLASGLYKNIFPFILQRIGQTQVFREFQEYTFRGIPPVFADSLPDDFGNQIFNRWVKEKGIDKKELSPILQLAYVSNRGMGALEYFPGKKLPKATKINLNVIVDVLKQVLDVKLDQKEVELNDLGLLNIFKIGTSAGGARPKVIVSEHKKKGTLLAGDLEYNDSYNHYLVKLGMGTDGYSRELVEYGYYQLACESGLHMMLSKMIDGKHFATLRYDRIDGEKKHVLTATGISGYNFQNPEVSSYENVFEIAHNLNLPSADMDALYRRMVFNYVFHNTDDHLKNHSFIYEKESDRWRIAPSYDINFALNALAKWSDAPHSLSLNGKRNNITKSDLLLLAKSYSIKRPKKIIEEICSSIPRWKDIALNLDIPKQVYQSIADEFKDLDRI